MPPYSNPYKYNPYPVARPAPTTWQQGQEYGAQDLWNERAGTVFGDEASARSGVGRTSRASTSALDRVNSWSPTNVAGYSPTDVKQYDPAAYYGWTPGAATDALKSLPARSASVGGGGSALERFAPSAQRGFSSADVSDFDPSSFGKEYATGAFGEFKNKLGDTLEGIQNENARTGRLQTGWFDRDRGRAIVRASSDFSNSLAQAATTFSGQRLSALQGGADLRLRAAQGVDTAELARAQGIDENTLRASAEADQYALGRADIGARTALSEEQLRASMGGEQARLGLERATELSRTGYAQAHDLDTLSFGARTTGLDAALRREQMARSSFDTAAGRAAGYTSATREWAASDREAQDQRDYQNALLAYRRQNPPGTGPGQNRSAYNAWVNQVNGAAAKAAGAGYTPLPEYY